MAKIHYYKAPEKIVREPIEVSDCPDFHRSELLHEFAVITDGITKVSFAPSRPYRYFRFQAPDDGFPSGTPPLAVSSFSGFCQNFANVFRILDTVLE